MKPCTKCKDKLSLIWGIDKNTGLCWLCIFPRP